MMQNLSVAIWQHVVRSDSFKHLVQLPTVAQHSVAADSVVEVVRVNVGEANALHDFAEIVPTFVR